MHLVMDLGTANFRVGAVGHEAIIEEPCVVVHNQYGTTHVGVEAAKMIGRSPDVIEIIRPVEGGAVKDVDAMATLIDYSLKHFNANRFSRKFSLTVAVSSHLTTVERKAVEEAGKLAGARHVDLVDASTSAARGAGLPIDTPTGCIVVDLGAATTEAALLSMRGVVDSRRVPVGGRQIDHNLIESVRKEYSFLIGERSAEDLKFRFSASGPDALEIPVKGRNLRTGLPDVLNIPRDMVEQEFAAYYDSIVQLIVQTLTSCPPELVGDIVERGIVVVGGGALITGIQGPLGSRTEVPVVVADNPAQCVIQGAIEQKWELEKTRSRIRIPMIG